MDGRVAARWIQFFPLDRSASIFKIMRSRSHSGGLGFGLGKSWGGSVGLCPFVSWLVLFVSFSCGKNPGSSSYHPGNLLDRRGHTLLFFIGIWSAVYE